VPQSLLPQSPIFLVLAIIAVLVMHYHMFMTLGE
jgi:hypothetical protein